MLHLLKSCRILIPNFEGIKVISKNKRRGPNQLRSWRKRTVMIDIKKDISLEVREVTFAKHLNKEPKVDEQLVIGL
jgi:hypothetical protein